MMKISRPKQKPVTVPLSVKFFTVSGLRLEGSDHSWKGREGTSLESSGRGAI